MREIRVLRAKKMTGKLCCNDLLYAIYLHDFSQYRI